MGLLLHGFGLTGYITGWVLSDLVYLILSTSLIVKSKSIKIYPVKETIPYLKTLARFAWPLFIANTVMFLYTWFDRALLLAYTPLTDVAVYDVAFKAFTVLYTIPIALGNTLFPYYAEQHGRNQHENIVAGVRVYTVHSTTLRATCARVNYHG